MKGLNSFGIAVVEIDKVLPAAAFFDFARRFRFHPQLIFASFLEFLPIFAKNSDSMTVNQPIVITIGRQFGSGGRELGKKLADRLGFKYYDKELLSEAAEHAGVDKAFFERCDERFPKFFNGIFSFAFGLSNVNCYAGSTSISDDSIYRAQSDFIHSLAERSNCVIVGRTSDYVLRDHERLVNIFVHAPIENCVARIMARDEENLTAEKARAKAIRMNKLRANYYNFYTDKEWGAASSYDLTFDTSRIGMDKVVDVIVAYITSRFPDFTPGCVE